VFSDEAYFSLAFLYGDLIDIVVISIYKDTRVQIDHYILNYHPKLTSLDDLKKYSGELVYRNPFVSTDSHLQVGRFFTKAGYKKWLNSLCDKAVKEISDFEKTLKIYKKSKGEPKLVRWDGMPLDATQQSVVDTLPCSDTQQATLQKLFLQHKDTYQALLNLLTHKEDTIRAFQDIDTHICQYAESYMFEIPMDDALLSMAVFRNFLVEENLLLIVDHDEGLDSYLEDGYLLELFDNQFKDAECISTYIKQAKDHLTVGQLEQTQHSDLLECIESLGYMLFYLDDRTDSYPVGIIKRENIAQALETGLVKIFGKP
jgi:hypothetical protein